MAASSFVWSGTVPPTAETDGSELNAQMKGGQPRLGWPKDCLKGGN